MYHWLLTDSLPVMPIPLASPDPDVLVSLAEVFFTTLDRGRYDRSIDYGKAFKLPLSEDERSWVEATARRST